MVVGIFSRNADFFPLFICWSFLSFLTFPSAGPGFGVQLGMVGCLVFLVVSVVVPWTDESVWRLDEERDV